MPSRKKDVSASTHLFNGPVRPADTTRRALAICLTVMCVPIVLCLIFYGFYSVRIMEREIYRNMQMTVEQGKNNLDYRMKQVEKNSRSILTTIYPYLNSQAYIDVQLQEYEEMMRIFSDYRNDGTISKLRLYVSSGKIYSAQNDTFYSMDVLTDDIDTDIEWMSSGTHWQETHEITVQFGSEPIHAISCVSAVSSAIRYDQLAGVMFLDLDVTQFNDMLSAGIKEGEALFVVNREGTVLIHLDASMIGTRPFQEEESFTQLVAQTGSVDLDGERNLMVATQLNLADWYLVMTVPARNVYAYGGYSLDMTRLFIILGIVALLLGALVITYSIIVRNTVMHINQVIGNTVNTLLHDGLEPIEQEALTPTPASSGQKALTVLEHNTDIMVSIITRLLERRYQDQIAVRDFQMKALQQQINPHFLYNTLDIIKWMIADGKNEDSIWMINALSRYFQLSLSSGRDIVCIDEEIRLTRTYIGIMQRRFKDVFTAEFDVESEASSCLIPKLSLQPIIENALLHGILYAQKPEKFICVRVMRENDQIIIDVEDNGNGIDPETLENIRHTGGSTGKGSYGLSNVIQRLHLFGADENGFEINSRKGIGTCVTLKFPVHEEEKASSEASNSEKT